MAHVGRSCYLPSKAALRPNSPAASRTCWMRTRLEAKHGHDHPAPGTSEKSPGNSDRSAARSWCTRPARRWSNRTAGRRTPALPEFGELATGRSGRRAHGGLFDLEIARVHEAARPGFRSPGPTPSTMLWLTCTNSKVNGPTFSFSRGETTMEIARQASGLCSFSRDLTSCQGQPGAVNGRRGAGGAGNRASAPMWSSWPWVRMTARTRPACSTR